MKKAIVLVSGGMDSCVTASCAKLDGYELCFLHINYNQKTPFKKISTNSNKYIFECFKTALQFVKKEKILGIINCPVSKEYLFKNKYQGITEYISRLSGYKGKEVMLIYNKELAVSPITTHIPVSQINKKINQSEITKKVKTINNFYIKFLNKKPNIAILGLNPHNYSTFKNFEEKKIIQKAINSLRSLKIKIIGPVSTDTSFMAFQRKNFDVIIGMYHDQVLTPFKALYNFNAINITLGLPFLRVSPDHGVAKNIAGKNEANPKSLIEAIKFFNNIK